MWYDNVRNWPFVLLTALCVLQCQGQMMSYVSKASPLSITSNHLRGHSNTNSYNQDNSVAETVNTSMPSYGVLASHHKIVSSKMKMIAALAGNNSSKYEHMSKNGTLHSLIVKLDQLLQLVATMNTSRSTIKVGSMRTFNHTYVLSYNTTKPHQTYSTNLPNFLSRAQRTIVQVSSCLNSAWMVKERKDGEPIEFVWPEDAEEHFHELKRLTVPFRYAKSHTYVDYAGPWIENHFINTFLNKPLDFFGGMIPIFVLWVENQLNGPLYLDRIYQVLHQNMRPDVVYFTVSQSALGLNQFSMDHPNLLVLSGGGFGHVPIPLIKGELAPKPLPENFSAILGFYGTIERSNRDEVLEYIAMEIISNHKNLSYRVAEGSTDWLELMASTQYNLAPRGFGRTSFRLAESIQLGRIPVYMYDDYEWLPYKNTDLDISRCGFSVKMDIPQDALNRIRARRDNNTSIECDAGQGQVGSGGSGFGEDSAAGCARAEKKGIGSTTLKIVLGKGADALHRTSLFKGSEQSQPSSQSSDLLVPSSPTPISKLLHKLTAITPSGYQEMLQCMQSLRHYYTYAGVIEEIELFIQDPLGPAGGHLRCTTFPRTHH